MVGSGDLVSALVVHYAMQLYVLHTAMYWADTCQVAKVQLTVGFRQKKYAYHLGWTEMYPHRQNFAQIHSETQTGAEILSCEACTGREGGIDTQNVHDSMFIPKMLVPPHSERTRCSNGLR